MPGPCHYCASISAPCTISIKRKQRPYYMVSEEEYRCAMQILQRFLPDKELNLEVLRDTALRMEGQAMNNSPSTSAETERRQESEAIRDALAVDHQGSPLPDLICSRDPSSSGENPQEPSGTSTKDLTERIGNLMIDSTGTISEYSA